MELEVGKTYYWKRSSGFEWNGKERWWDFFVEILGYNGVMGYWIKEKSRWNEGSEMKHLDQVRSLSLEESLKLEQELTPANGGKEKHDG